MTIPLWAKLALAACVTSWMIPAVFRGLESRESGDPMFFTALLMTLATVALTVAAFVTYD